MNTRLRSILLIGLIVILAGAAVFIGYQISIRQQAPDDAAADVFCTAPRPGGQCPVGDPIDGCNVWDWRANDAACGPAGECYQRNHCTTPPPPPGGACSVTFPGGVTGSIVIANCSQTFPMEVHRRNAAVGSTDSSCVGTHDPSAPIRQVGNGTYSPRNDEAGCGKCVQYDIEGQGGVAGYTGDCTVTPPPPPVEPITCYRCTVSATDGNTCESFPVNGDSCPAGSSISPTGCAAAIGTGQCPVTEEPKTCYRCTTDNLTDGNTCEGFTIDEDELCSANGGFDTQAECQDRLPTAEQCPVTITDDGTLTLVKRSTEVCEEGTNNHILSYTVTLTNIGEVSVAHSEVIDVLQNINSAVITAVSDSGIASGGNTITWPAATLAADQSETYTYTVTLTQAQADALDDILNNRVQVSYTAGELIQLSYTNNQGLTCSTLPNTALEDDLIWILAILLIIGGVITYRTQWGQQMLLNTLGGIETTLNKQKASRRSFEQKVLDEIE